MSTRTMNEDRFELEDLPAMNSTPRILSVLAAIPARFRTARNIARQARLLYAMSDEDLRGMGLDREEIPARLLNLYSE